MERWAPARRWRLATAALTVTVLMVTPTACSSEPPEGPRTGETAEQAVSRYAKAWESGDVEALAALTDDPKAARSTIQRAVADLGIARTEVEASRDRMCSAEDCRQTLRVTHTVEGLGNWTYDTTIELQKRGQRQVVRWKPAAFHPSLAPGRRFRVVRELPPRAAILDRDGHAITKERNVVRVKVDPAKVTDQGYAALQRHLGLDAAALRKKVAAARESTSDPTPGQESTLVPAITVREAVWANIAGHLRGLPGIVAENGTMSLGPTSSFARGIIGHLGTADGDDAAALLDDAGPSFLPTDEIGLSGLQRAFQRELAGRPGGRIELYEPATGDITHRLVEMKPRAGTPVKTTLSLEIQTAAESAVVGAKKPTAVVAVRSSTGEILAAAGGPGVTPFNRGFEGKYPPGSTFKVITAAALLENGLTINDRVTCPATVDIGGKRFVNAGDTALQDGPFVDAFAHSCNTTIVARAESVTGDDLTTMAQRFGIGEQWDLGLPAFSGSVPEPGDLVDRAATMIGQSRVLMSPLGMAMVAAAVESGRPRTPTLLAERRSRPLPELAPELRRDLTALMRAVVTRGSARQVLSGVPGAIHAKTGTAEYVAGDGIRTHAWMIGFRDDLAFAVVIEGGGAGGKDAGPIVRRFLQSVG